MSSHTNFDTARDIPHGNFAGNPQYRIGENKNGVCSNAQSTLFANTFQPQLLNKSSEYKCAALQPDYVGAEVNSTKVACTSCGGCAMPMSLATWNYLPPVNLYACSGPDGQGPQIVNPMVSVSGAPITAADTRSKLGVQMAANDQAIANVEANQQALAAQIVKSSLEQKKAATASLVNQPPPATAFVTASPPIEGFGGPGAFGSATPGVAAYY